LRAELLTKGQLFSKRQQLYGSTLSKNPDSKIAATNVPNNVQPRIMEG